MAKNKTISNQVKISTLPGIALPPFMFQPPFISPSKQLVSASRFPTALLLFVRLFRFTYVKQEFTDHVPREPARGVVGRTKCDTCLTG